MAPTLQEMGREHDNDTGTKRGTQQNQEWHGVLVLASFIISNITVSLSKPLLLYAPVAPTLYPLLVSWHLPPYTAGAQPYMAESPNITARPGQITV